MTFHATHLDFAELIAWGRYSLREIEALNGLHKYREMKKRYYD